MLRLPLFAPKPTPPHEAISSIPMDLGSYKWGTCSLWGHQAPYQSQEKTKISLFYHNFLQMTLVSKNLNLHLNPPSHTATLQTQGTKKSLIWVPLGPKEARTKPSQLGFPLYNF